MPSSRWDNIPDIINIIREVKPQSILDVGCGFGKWGLLAREYTDVWNGNYHPSEWKVRIDAIEIFPDYIQDWHRAIYNEIIVGDISNLELGYDLILAIDVIEHLRDAKADLTILRLKHYSKTLVLSIPLGSRPQGKVFNNKYEAHRSTWTLDKIKQYNPTRLKTHGNQALAVWFQ